MKHRIAILNACLMTTLCGSTLYSDVLDMQNGESFTGEVVKKEGDTLVFKSESTGRVTVKWSQVAGLKTDKPIKVLQKNGTVRECSILVPPKSSSSPLVELDQEVVLLAISDMEIINPDSWEMGEGWEFQGRFNLSVKYDRGDSDSDEIDMDTEISLRDLKNRFEASGELEKDRTSSILTEDKWLAEGTYNRFFSDKSYGLAYVMSEQDRFSELELRRGGGLGVGHQFFDRNSFNLLVELLAGRMQEEYFSDPNEDYWGGGWRVNTERDILKGRAQCYLDHTGFWDIEKSHKVFTKTWIGARVPLGGRISGTLELKHEFDSGAVNQTKETDWTYRLKLGYEW